jgi:hypothetical protein
MNTNTMEIAMRKLLAMEIQQAAGDVQNLSRAAVYQRILMMT